MPTRVTSVLRVVYRVVYSGLCSIYVLVKVPMVLFKIIIMLFSLYNDLAPDAKLTKQSATTTLAESLKLGKQCRVSSN